MTTTKGVHVMRKNIQNVIRAFNQNKRHSEKTCHTDWCNIFSYAMKIVERVDGKVLVIPYSNSPSVTTSSHLRACAKELLTGNEFSAWSKS